MGGGVTLTPALSLKGEGAEGTTFWDALRVCLLPGASGSWVGPDSMLWAGCHAY